MKLKDAQTFDEIADVLAWRCWGLRHGDKGKNCPADMIPTPRDLSEFIERTGITMFRAPTERGGHQDILFYNADVGRSVGLSLQMMRHFTGQTGVALCYMPRNSSKADMEDAAEHCDAIETTSPAIKRLVEDFHRAWQALETIRVELHDEAEKEWRQTGMRSRMQLVDGRRLEFIDEPSPIAPSKPEPFTHYAQSLIDLWQTTPRKALPFVPVTKASLPHINRIDRESTRELPTFDTYPPNPKDDDGQLELLPLGGLDESAVSWLLRLYHQVGGDTMRKGKGAPYELRLFIGALLHFHIAQRDGQIWHIDIPTNRVIAWLHPNGWGNKRRDWHRLPEALKAIRSRLNAVSIKGVGSVQLMTVAVIPEQPTDPWVRFALMVPMQAAKGVRIDWRRLCAYGTMNAPLYCAYLSASVAMDESARRGTSLTKDIFAPVVRDTKQLVPNPAARFVGGYTKDDLTRMAGMDPTDRKHKHRAMEAFEQLDDDGAIDLQTDGLYWRIFGASPERRTGRAIAER